MQIQEKTLTTLYLAIYIGMVIWSVLLWQTNQSTSTWNYLYNLGSASFFLTGGLIALSYALRSKIKSSVEHELIVIGLGVLLFGIGLSIWSYYNLVLNIESPYPSLSDATYVLYSPILTYGLINLLRVTGAKITAGFYLKFLTVFSVIAYLIYVFGGPPDLSAELPFLHKFLNVYYLLADALLISLGLMIIYITKAKIHNSFFFFLLALFSMAIADLTFYYRSGEGTYYNGDIADVFYALSGCMFALGIIRLIATQSILNKYFTEEVSKNPQT